jgi:hypothetical protein
LPQQRSPPLETWELFNYRKFALLRPLAHESTVGGARKHGSYRDQKPSGSSSHRPAIRTIERPTNRELARRPQDRPRSWPGRRSGWGQRSVVRLADVLAGASAIPGGVASGFVVGQSVAGVAKLPSVVKNGVGDSVNRTRNRRSFCPSARRAFVRYPARLG